MRLSSVCVFFTALLVIGCSKNPMVPIPHTTASSIVSASIAFDYSAGNMGQYVIGDSAAYRNAVSIYQDNDIRTFGHSTYVLERYGKDNIVRFDGPSITASAARYEKNIGASVNIQDIAFVDSTKAYITQYQSTQAVIFNPSTGSKTGTIDLSHYVAYYGTDSAAPYPYMSRALYANGKVYIACQRLKAPTGGFIHAADTSLLVVVNAATDQVVKTIRLNFKNPQELSIFNGKMYVAGLGLYGVNDGGIECIDLSTDTDIGAIVTEAAFNGDVGSLIVTGDAKGYAVISTPAFTTELHPFNPQARTVGATIAGVDAPCTNHLAFDGRYVYVGDRSMTNPGIVIIDPATDAKTGATKNIGLPPNSLAFLNMQ